MDKPSFIDLGIALDLYSKTGRILYSIIRKPTSRKEAMTVVAGSIDLLPVPKGH